MHQERANFPFLATNIVDAVTGQLPPWVTPSVVFTVNGVKVGVIGAELESTPELVSAGATAGLKFLDEGPRIEAESERLRAHGVRVQVVVIHEGTSRGQNPIGNTPGAAWEGPIMGIADELQDTTVDAMIVGHTHRISNLMRGNILITEGINAGATYSALQPLVKGGDVAWAGGATRVAKNIGVAPRADVKAIVDDANAKTAVLRNQVIGTQSIDIRRDPDRLKESAMGNMVADAMRAKYPGIDAALHQLGRAPAGSPDHSSECERAAGGDHVGRGLRRAALRQPDDDPDAHRGPAQGGVPERLLAGLQPERRDGPLPAGVGAEGDVQLQRHDTGRDGMWKTPTGPGGTLIPIGPTDTVRLVTNDFMYGGGDGYTVLAGGTNVQQPGDDLMQIVVDYIGARSPVAPVVDGRLIQQ